MAMLVKGVAPAQHIQSVEALREHWITRTRTPISRQLQPVRSAHPAQQPAVMNGDRDSWVQTISRQQQLVANAFADHTLPVLASLVGMDASEADTSQYRDGVTRFLQAYAQANVPDYVDHVLTSFAAKHRDLSSPTPKAAMAVRRRAAAVSRPSPRASSPTLPGGNDWETVGGDEAEPYSHLLDGVEDLVCEMVTVAASGLGALASAVSFADANDVELEKSWSAVMDDKTRLTHAEADGQTQSLEDPFDVGDSQMMFPLDESMGADIGEIIYCRCVVMFDTTSGTKERLRPRTWADRMLDIVVMNLPGVLRQEGGANA